MPFATAKVTSLPLRGTATRLRACTRLRVGREGLAFFLFFAGLRLGFFRFFRERAAVKMRSELRRWGCSPSVAAVWVSFSFRFSGSVSSVSVFCRSRRSAARLLWRFRRARRWFRSLWRVGWGGVLVPPAFVAGSRVPRFGLRWLASRRVRVCVSVRAPFRVCSWWRPRWFAVPSVS